MQPWPRLLCVASQPSHLCLELGQFLLVPLGCPGAWAAAFGYPGVQSSVLPAPHQGLGLSLLTAESPPRAAAPSTCPYFQEPCPAQGPGAVGCRWGSHHLPASALLSLLTFSANSSSSRRRFSSSTASSAASSPCVSVPGDSAGTARVPQVPAVGPRSLWGDGPGAGVGAYPSACLCAAPRFLSPAPWPPAGGGEAGPGWPGRVPRSAGRRIAGLCRSPGSGMARARWSRHCPQPLSPHLASAASGPAGGRTVSRWRAALGRRREMGVRGPAGPLVDSTPRPGLTCAALFRPVRPGPAGPGSAPAPPVRAGGPELPRPPAPPAAGTALRDGEGPGGSARPPQPRSRGVIASHRASPSPQNRCQRLPSLCRSSCWVLARISAICRSWASSSSCGGCRCSCTGGGCRGSSPCATRGAPALRGWTAGPGEATPKWPTLGFGVHRTSSVSLLEVGSAVRSRALSRGVSTSPRGAPRARPGPRCPRTAGGTSRSTK